ncbi:type I-B CRISPR-associated protein Cas8b1/Cst1 [Caldisericum exile]|uniref:CRISPR-associated protein n=1 Tax=Caldisericum exile (strain DSM 21853 / NBRC 104410 / AZM16c01) TaxID=511051 RepID=A0A7U6GDL0_CALEA|nr:type I-B CRISPR-associated protein Cas8b1/Cst1 [Caldisericum exile]BAL80395.1 putative CRISPR-associated protein [Caldisericum exile AZM16c01]
MSEKFKVYLSDWLFNAGIIGFLKIMTNDNIEDQKIVTIGENYIEFERESIKGFSEKYFNTAFKQYGRYDRTLQTLKEFLEDLRNVRDSKNLETISRKYEVDKNNLGLELPLYLFNRFKNKFPYFKFLNNVLPDDEEIKKDPNKVEKIFEEVAALEEKHKEIYQKILENDVRSYLKNIYGQKSFLNNSIRTGIFNKFYNDFEKPIVENTVKQESELYCVNCGRPAKKDTSFDTGISPFFGINKDASNFLWKFNTKLPLCEICELIYFCSFAALTPSVYTKDKTFYFVNSDSSVIDLYQKNRLLSLVLKKEGNPILDFFPELIIELQKEKAYFSLRNIALIELNLNDGNFPKIYSFNISKAKALYLNENANTLKKLAKASYKIKDKERYVLFETIEKILRNEINYEFLYSLERMFLSNSNKNKQNLNPYHLQVLNLLILNFIKNTKNEGRNKMDLEEKEVWNIYFKGKELSKKMRDRNAENKIHTIAYKLLNALKASDVNYFMDVIMRTFMAYEMEIPSDMVKVLLKKDNFYPLGYGFLNGFLDKKGDEKENE